ncbi:MAG: exodeoxyribonuclease III [Acidimicrobiales bacterium]
MRIATWNVNSLNIRMPRVIEWLDYAQPDVVCLQETKMNDGAFPAMEFATLGYESAHHGTGRWNGVAILSRCGLTDVAIGLPGKLDPMVAAEESLASVLAEPRMITATCGGIVVSSVYVPNGREVGADHYRAKLAWLEQLGRHLGESGGLSGSAVLAGDFNVAPADNDVWDIGHFEGATHVSGPEREALEGLMALGMVDAFRLIHAEDRLFSWWDYRAGAFHQHRGMRIDLMLVTKPVAERVSFALIDRQARKGQQPSDHAPVFIDLAPGPASVPDTSAQPIL